uniref:Ribosomal RNA-processing protein 14/surfeit locus protein 6 C-terminal domain-containing protein n=2 Tax=Kalanchoe fedtschenkoi TaxID=63787 RepID=A0A7N0VFY8_KALFE
MSPPPCQRSSMTKKMKKLKSVCGPASPPELNKAKKALAKKETKENIKKARRDTLDPEKSSSTSTLDLLKQNLEKEIANKAGSDNDDVEIELNLMVCGSEDEESRSVTYEELRQRLRRKIEAMSSARNNSNPEKHDKEKDRLEHRERKRKRLAGSEDVRKLKEDKFTDNVQKDTTEAAKELTFGHVKLGDDDDQSGKKKRKLSKVKELERARKLEEAKKDPEKGEVIAKKHSWKAATSRAAGIKIHDDPKLLDKSLKKEKKTHENSADKWKDRIETQRKKVTEKQQKRADNIKDRKEQKRERKIAKREKKLLRPGFEGCKDQPLNGAKA